jgi:hypothetical protein
LFEFNPARHDFGTKTFWGMIKGSGFGEVKQALDLIAASPATAHHISAELAAYFVRDTPPPALIDRMAATFHRSGGDIAAVLRTLFASAEFKASLGKAFGIRSLRGLRRAAGLWRSRDPQHRSAGQLAAADGRRTLRSRNAGRICTAILRLVRPRADGDPFRDRARHRRRLGRPVQAEDGGVPEQPAFPQIQNVFQALQPRLRAQTAGVLAQARSLQEWNGLYLSSPEFIRR